DYYCLIWHNNGWLF
nr:immunoglobulin light chain junction region [Macaca mulatta]MOX80061.1 immunoglobulin light chain junction region [Macaca mulatta]MOX80068.1 immunoglobulin light chain junction region [Macaca mulatta]MOX81092.1 immunoglobulin light chain junction region [Macaca mulatta]MOX81414.1 immunoglobulin light chain junction region [Macaca mulatta]